MVCRPFWYVRRPSAGAVGAPVLTPDACDAWLLRRSFSGPSNPASSASPLENGFWNTTPGGCTVIEEISGRRLRCRYATVTDVTTGDVEALPESSVFHCMYRAFG